MRLSKGGKLILLLISTFSIFSGIYYTIYSLNELRTRKLDIISLGNIEKPEVIIIAQAFIIVFVTFIIPLGWLYIAENHKGRREAE